MRLRSYASRLVEAPGRCQAMHTFARSSLARLPELAPRGGGRGARRDGVLREECRAWLGLGLGLGLGSGVRVRVKVRVREECRAARRVARREGRGRLGLGPR